MNLPLLFCCGAILAFEVASLVKFWRRCDRTERELRESWERVMARLDEADRRRRQR